MEYINEQNINNAIDDVAMSDDSDHYYDHIANPAKVKSKKDLQIDNLENQLDTKNQDVENLGMTIQEQKQKLDKLENQQNYVQAAINFLNIEFEFDIDNVQLEMYSYESIKNFKTMMLSKAKEITQIKKMYDELINWEDIDDTIWYHFDPQIQTKFQQIDKIFTYDSQPVIGYMDNIGKVFMGLTVIAAVAVRVYHFFY